MRPTTGTDRRDQDTKVGTKSWTKQMLDKHAPKPVKKPGT
jgi:hypothetical protein